jgi:hypothetical protein
MPRLAQVFELANRYGADDVQFDIETKIDPTVEDTVDPVTFTAQRARRDPHVRHDAAVAAPVVRLADARGAKKELPALKTVALAQARRSSRDAMDRGRPDRRDAWSAGTLAAGGQVDRRLGRLRALQDITDALIRPRDARGRC